MCVSIWFCFVLLLHICVIMFRLFDVYHLSFVIYLFHLCLFNLFRVCCLLCLVLMFYWCETICFVFLVLYKCVICMMLM